MFGSRKIMCINFLLHTLTHHALIHHNATYGASKYIQPCDDGRIFRECVWFIYFAFSLEMFGCLRGKCWYGMCGFSPPWEAI